MTGLPVKDSSPKDLIKVLLELPDDAIISGYLDVQETTNKTAEQYYKHDNGNYRSIKNRMEIAMTIPCIDRDCGQQINKPCISKRHGSPIRYPHNSRLREALRQAAEEAQMMIKFD